MAPQKDLFIGCHCARVRLIVRGAHIMSVECHCESCRSAGECLEMLAAAPVFRSPNDGTPYVMVRKDRVSLTEGGEYLREFRLHSGSKTRRVVATCCNSPVFLEFQAGHWLSLYAALWPAGTAPRPTLRTMVGDRPDGVVLSSDIRNAKSHTAGFMAKLLGAWVAMGFRSPNVDYVSGTLELPAQDLGPAEASPPEV